MKIAVYLFCVLTCVASILFLAGCAPHGGAEHHWSFIPPDRPLPVVLSRSYLIEFGKSNNMPLLDSYARGRLPVSSDCETGIVSAFDVDRDKDRIYSELAHVSVAPPPKAYNSKSCFIVLAWPEDEPDKLPTAFLYYADNGYIGKHGQWYKTSEKFQRWARTVKQIAVKPDATTSQSHRP